MKVEKVIVSVENVIYLIVNIDVFNWIVSVKGFCFVVKYICVI